MWLFGIGFVIVLCAVSRKQTPQPKPVATRVSGMQTSAIAALNQCVMYGLPVRQGMPEAALFEAQRKGDGFTYQAIWQMFFAPPPQNPQPQPQPKQEIKQMATPKVATLVSGSPIEGVADDEWNRFAAAFATHSPEYKDAQHVGKFYHHKQRLAELGIPPDSLADEQSQYKAFETDVKDTMTRQAKFINEFAGDTVEINGQAVAVSRSGALALLKCAGPENARAWLTGDSALRTKFPQTIKIFNAANQLF